MSIQLIQKYYAEVDRIIRYGGNCKMSKRFVIELLGRACTVSVPLRAYIETISYRAHVKIVKEISE